jgi:phosphoribosylformylglycinamidine cyclo-ligase
VPVEGASTKASLVYLYYKETGVASVRKVSPKTPLFVMNICNLIRVGTTADSILLSSIIGRNKNRILSEVISEKILKGMKCT